MARARTVDEYLASHPEAGPALRKLRKVLVASGMDETVKWGAPCYCVDGKNVVGLGAFSSYVGLWFHQGVFLEDGLGVLVNAQEGQTKALRQWRFEKAADIDPKAVRRYVDEAIANERAGKRMGPVRKKALAVPAELRERLDADETAAAAFAALTPGRQREYAEHVASAKREATRQDRAQKVLPLIRKGVGLHDKYRSC